MVVTPFASADNGILAGSDPALHAKNTDNELDMKKGAVNRTMYRMGKVYDRLEMWQWSQNLSTTKKESRTPTKQMTHGGYISNTEEMLKASSSPFQQDCAAAFKLWERSPFRPPVSAKDLPGGLTPNFHVHRIRRINCHLVENDDASAPESISDTEAWPNWNGDYDNPHGSYDDCAADS